MEIENQAVFEIQNPTTYVYLGGDSPTLSFFHFSTMKIFTGVIFCSLVLGVSSESWYSFFKEAVQGKGAEG